MIKLKPDNIAQEDWDAVDSPPLSSAFIAGMRPARETSPHLVEAYRRGREMLGPRRRIAQLMKLNDSLRKSLRAQRKRSRSSAA